MFNHNHRSFTRARLVVACVLLLGVRLAVASAVTRPVLNAASQRPQPAVASRVAVPRALNTDDALHGAQTETISFCEAPAPLPRNQPLTNYSPALCFAYGGLKQETYSLRVFLLETGGFTCASNQWCGEVSNPQAIFTINNSNGANTNGSLTVIRTMDVFDFPNFLWVADLYNQAGVKILSANPLPAGATALRPPVLNAIGSKTGMAGEPLEFFVTATAPSGSTASLSVQNLPTGANFDAATGRFSWPAPVAGTYSNLLFKATLNGAVSLSDAELVTIQIGPGQTQTVSFSAANYSTGEGGPAIAIVTRSSGAGTASVQYATANGTATAGSDYTAASGTLNFAAGETAKAISVTINNDAQAEADETFTITLSNPVSTTLAAPITTNVTIIDDDTPAVAGQWSSVSPWPVVPIHIHLLPNGKVLFWDRHNDTLGWDGTPRLWDPATGVFTTLTAPNYDLFCSGHAFLADGKLLITGGHIPMPPPNDSGVGENKASLFDSLTNTFTPLPVMNAGRWYPSNVTLANGDALVLAGTTVNVNTVNTLPQVWQAASSTWRNLTTAMQGNQPDWADFYPFLYLAPNGRVFNAGPQAMARYLDTAGTGAWTNVAGSSLVYRDYGSSVMYDDGKVLIVGGNPRDPNPNPPTSTILPSATAEVINLAAAQPAWRAVAPMSVGRRHATATLLADGKVLVTGGSALPGFDNPAGAVKFAEQWDPTNETWRPMAGAVNYRGYHSNALLLPDGRVLVTGGGHPDPAGGAAQLNAEIYSPPYLFKGARPTITTAPAQIAYSQTFQVQTPDAASITGATLIRLGSVTHAFNQNQRINRLSVTAASGAVNITAPANANLCPPGHYLLFLLNSNGVPSMARVVQVIPGQAPCQTVSGINPTSGAVGSTVTINGANFTGVTAVKFSNNVIAQFNIVNDTQITATVPSGAVTGPITISKPGCPDAQTTAFTVVCAYTIAPTSQAFNAAGGNGSVAVTTASGCAWTASSNASWLSVTFGSSGNGNGTVNFTVAANTDNTGRVGSLSIAGNTFTVVQAGAGGNCTPTPIIPVQIIGGTLSANDCRAISRSGTTYADRYSFSGAIGQQVDILMRSAAFDAYLGLLDPNGMVIAGNDDGGGGVAGHDARIQFTLPANGTYIIEAAALRDGATGDYTLGYNATIAGCSYSIAPTSQSFQAIGGAGNISITTGIGCGWAVASGVSWITITAGSSGSGNGTISYTVAPNTSITSRTGTLLITGQNLTMQTFTVTQPGCASIALTSQAFNAEGGTGNLTVTAVNGCAWTASSNANWINITSGGNGSGNGTVNFTVAATTDNTGRVGTLAVAGSNFTVVQSGAGGSCTPTPIIPAQIIGGTLSTNDCRAVSRGGTTYADRYSFSGASGQQVDIILRSAAFDAFLGLLDATGRVLATNDDGGGGVNGRDSRIGFTLPTDGTYIIEAASLSSGITGDYTLSYNAAVAGCNYSIAPTSQSFQAGGGTGSVNITTASGCSWAAASSVSWLTITAGGSANGNGTISYTVAPNTSITSRTGTLLITGQNLTIQTFTVTQPGCASIALTSQAFNAEGGTGSLTVTAVNGCAWTASSNASWLTLTSGSSGSGNGTVNFTVAANTDNTGRIGTLAVAGSTFTVVQSGAGGSCTPTPIIPAQIIGGTLSTNDCRAISRGGTSFADRYSFSGASGQQVDIILRSAAFDAFLGLLDATGRVLATNDDGGGGVNGRDSRIQFTLPLNGTYIIEATSLSSGITGDYALSYNATNCNYSISPTNQSFQASGGTASVTVTANTGCSWGAASNVSWITITAGNSGSGNGTVSYSVAPNTSTTSRSGTLAIAGQIFTVTQGDASNCQTVTGLTPTNGSAGSVVTITGMKFTGVNAIKFTNNATAQFTVNSDTQITATVPSGAATGPITISKPNCPDAQTGVFTITPRVISAGMISAAPGSTVSLPIELVSQGDENAFSFSLTFDPALLSNPQAVAGSDAAGAQFNTNANQAAQGRFGMTVALTSGTTFSAGTRQLAVVTFTIAANAAAGATPIGFGDQPIVREVADASANILPAGFAPGAVTISSGYEADVAPRPNGNNNGTVTITDAVQVGRFVAGLDTAVIGSEFQRGDCAPRATLGDGRLTVSDWVQAGRYAAGLDPVMPAGGPAMPMQLQSADCGLRIGGQRISSSCNPSTASSQSAISKGRDPQSRVVQAAMDRLAAGGERRVTLELDAQGDEHALGFSLRFNPSQWHFVSATAGRDALAATLIINSNDAARGRIGCALVLPVGQTFGAGARQLVVLTLAAVRSADLTPLALSFGDEPVAREIVDAEARPLAIEFALAGQALTNVSASSFSDEALARGQIVAAFGMELATHAATAQSSPLPTELAGTHVVITDSQGVARPAPLFFVSPAQVNYQFPPETAEGIATVTITSGDGTVATGSAEIAAVAPGLFTANGDGQGVAAAMALRVKADGSQQFEPLAEFDAARGKFIARPLTFGDINEEVYLVLFGTGLRFHSLPAAISVRLGVVEAPVLYAGPQGEYAGLDQVNVRLPRDLAGGGEVDVALTVDGKKANPVRIKLK